ncbi:MAG: hypothetical protein KY476_23525, partial [Planctomycetes bacterium]|nr:hypothetical protein [Planctomycetota bacterium]
GEHGFGYDPHFLVPEYHRTFGELGPMVKRAISHRARAFEQLLRGLAVATHGNRPAGFAPAGPNSTARGNAPGAGAHTTRQP